MNGVATVVEAGTPGKDRMNEVAGSELLKLVTAGLYSDPLVIYREYIQNAADSIASGSDGQNGQVEIELEHRQRRITIRDNGPGLSESDARRQLVRLGRSEKSSGTDRGFRGIGRLAALGFAETVTFRTRSEGDTAVSWVTWTGSGIRGTDFAGMDVGSAVSKSVEMGTVSGDGWPTHFFEVVIENVARHAAGVALNEDVVRAYIGAVCPVPMRSDFPFRQNVEALFPKENRPLTLRVHINGDDSPVTRPHGPGVRLPRQGEEPFVGVETCRVPTVDGNGTAAVGWIAHWAYSGAIPKGVAVRGVRARQGNIQVGSENVFADLFAEARFNRWCVGEIHILDNRIRPNARRDYFEAGPHVRNLENHLESFLRGVAVCCRRASSSRNQARKRLAGLRELEETCALVEARYLSAEHARSLVVSGLREIEKLQRVFVRSEGHEEPDSRRLQAVKARMSVFEFGEYRSMLDDLAQQESEVYSKVFRAVTQVSPSMAAARRTIEEIVRPE